MVLVGKSGCGKTTLLHVIAGITRPIAAKSHQQLGHYDYAGAECDRFERSISATSSRRFNLLRGFSALENVMLAMRFARLPAKMPASPCRCWARCSTSSPAADRGRFAARLNMSSPHVDRARAMKLLERVGLGHRLTHKPTQLSVASSSALRSRGRWPIAQAAAGRRAHRERRFGPSAADPRFVA